MKKWRSGLGPRLVALRKARGLTQQQVADRVGGTLTASTVSRYERSVVCPTVDQLESMLFALGSDLGRFFAAEDGHMPDDDLGKLVGLVASLPEPQINVVRRLVEVHLEGVRLAPSG